MLSAERRDVPILNAVAASLSVGYEPPIMFTMDGKLDQVISQAIAYADEGNQESQNVSDVAPEPATPETQKSSGTGFVVSMNGEVLTNAHVVAGCAKLTFDGSLASVVAESSDFDLAILQIEDWSGEHVATFSPAPARLNSDVTVVGYPLAGILSGLNVTRGAVSSQLGLGGEVTAMQITAPVQPGNSGGPVLAADGEVVGVVVSKLNAQRVADATGDIPQNVNFAVRGEIAKLFLFQNGIEPVLGTDDTVLSPVDLADIAKNFTGFIECN
jgi:S1-C subfamily serine protease